MVKGKAPAAAKSSTEPEHRQEILNIDPTTENRALGIQGDTTLIPRSLAGNLIKNISVEFPKFSREDPRGWIKRCQYFFNVDPVLEH